MANETSIELGSLYGARLEELRQIAKEHDVDNSGAVEYLRARLIATLVLDSWDLSTEGLKSSTNAQLADLCRAFGIKSSGSKTNKQQRLYLHIHHDRRELSIDSVYNLSDEDIMTLATGLGFDASEERTSLERSIIGTLAQHEKGWGLIKRTLKRRASRGEDWSAPRPPIPRAALPPEPELDAGEGPEEEEIPTDVGIGTPDDEEVEEPGPPSKKMKVDEPLTIPSMSTSLALDQFITQELQTRLRTRIETFVDQHGESWKFSDEARLRTELASSGILVDHPRVSAAVEMWLAEAADRKRASRLLEEADARALPAEVLVELDKIEARKAEVIVIARDLLAEPFDIEVLADRDRFYERCEEFGILALSSAGRQALKDILVSCITLRSEEEQAGGREAGSWREREAIKRFDSKRKELVELIEREVESADGDLVRARIESERLARDVLRLDLDLSVIAGRFHGVFEIHTSLMLREADVDPVRERRRQAIEALRFDQARLSAESVDIITRLSEHIEGLEQLIEVVIRRSKAGFDHRAQSNVVRMLERKGYAINTPELRPRILAAAGVLALELGYITTDDAPRLPTGLTVDERQLAQVVNHLNQLADKMAGDNEEEVIEDGQFEKEAKLHEQSETMSRLRTKLDSADRLMRRLQGNDDNH